MLALFEGLVLPSILVRDDKEQPADSILLPCAIKFFTANILAQLAKSSDSVSSQARYHTALSKLYAKRIKIIKGYYSLTEARAKQIDPENSKLWPRDLPDVLVWKPEEKQSDVSLALHAYHDAMTGEADHLVFVTNDTDLAPALKMIREHTSARVGLIIPTRKQDRVPNTDLAEAAHWVRTHITEAELEASQLPRVILGRKPTIKPISWYARPDLLTKAMEMAKPVLREQGKIFKWLEQPNQHFDGVAPIDLLETDQSADRVFSYIRD